MHFLIRAIIKPAMHIWYIEECRFILLAYFALLHQHSTITFGSHLGMSNITRSFRGRRRR